MDMDKLNRWMTLFANFGVIAGIIVLAVELQQNNEQLKIQIATTLHEIRMNDMGVQLSGWKSVVLSIHSCF